jgi:hypothetical protein
LPSAEALRYHPWLAGGLGILNTLIGTKLMSDVKKEERENQAKAEQLIGEEAEKTSANEKRFSEIMDKILAQEGEQAEQNLGKTKAEISKIMQEIAESKARPENEIKKINAQGELENKREEARAKREAELNEKKEIEAEIKRQVKLVESYKDRVKPEIYNMLLKKAMEGKFSDEMVKENPKRIWNYLPKASWFGLNQDKDERYGLSDKIEEKAEDLEEPKLEEPIKNSGKKVKFRINKETGKVELK